MVNKMKRLLLVLIISLFIIGCDKMGSTPISKVENLLNQYQTLDNNITSEIENVIDDDNLSNEQKNRYRKIIEKQYKNLTYEIKDDIIDKDTAIVTVSIEVLNYKEAIDKLNLELHNQDYNMSEYTRQKLDKLEEVDEKVMYTMDFNLNLNEDEEWKLEPLTNVQKKKMQGMY